MALKKTYDKMDKLIIKIRSWKRPRGLSSEAEREQEQLFLTYFDTSHAPKCTTGFVC
jgi:hypothetical protein